MEVIKNRQQTHQCIPAWTLMKQIWAMEGCLGFFRGYWMSLAVFMPYTVILFQSLIQKMSYFVIYEKLKGFLQSHDQPLTLKHYIMASSTSGAIAGAISHALDVIKTRYQVGQEKKVMQVIKIMIQQEGVKAFRNGLFHRISYIIPSVALSMSIYEILKDYYNNN
jgi:solute carrier family 25 iron transporter 28/37